jgi:SAM-dependent methyltransferase
MGNINNFGKRLPSINVFRKIKTISSSAIQSGFIHLVSVGYVNFIEPLVMDFASVYAKFALWKKRIWKRIYLNRDLARWSLRKTELIQKGEGAIGLEELGLGADGLKLLNEKVKLTREVVIANIDQDGFYLSKFGPIDGIPCISEESFLPRNRFTLDLIVIGGVIGIKKNYCGNGISFLTELESLYTLSKTECNVPTILDADFENYSLTVSFIPGAVLREQLASKGSILRDRDVELNPEFTKLSPSACRIKRIEEGKKNLPAVVDTQFIEEIYDQIRRIHSANIFINDIKYGNIIIEKKTGNPYLIDFESSGNLNGLRPEIIRILTDCDIENFNLHFGTNKLTYKTLKKIIKHKKYPFPKKWYAPAYIGAGLSIGALWNPEVGWGRWQYILKDNLPDVTGFRVLDLGANNGFNSLQLIRSGAREVVGFEIDPDAIEQGMFLKAAFEWFDGRRFNFRYIESNMADLISMDLGTFDLVIALCSLYYLDDDEITSLIRHISSITNCFIVQCNLAKNIGRNDLKTYEKASVEYLKEALENNGFPQVKVIAPRGYSRPLLIAHRQ